MNTMNSTSPHTADRPQATTCRRAPILLALCLVGLGLLVTAPALAKDYTFTWSANPEPVEGYKLYYKKDGAAAPPFDGTGATEGAAPIDVGKVTTYTITGLDDNATYHFALTAYSGSEESGYSAIVTVNPAAASNTAPAPQLLQIKVK
ncbi:MAG: fibronectin type III domain-containing protein [Proteobacteria bacterium]|nr:fibronectin type III domain-containing protein [Pseudomonadota bacterium]